MMDGADSAESESRRVVALLGFFLCWWVYQLYATPLGESLSITTMVVSLASILLVGAVVHALASQSTILINNQVIALGLLHAFSLLTILWAESSITVIQDMKFYLILYVGFVVLVVSLNNSRKTWLATAFLLLTGVFSIAITIFFVALASGASVGAITTIRHLEFDTQANFLALSVLVTLPILVHLFYHPPRRVWRRAASLLIVLGIGVLIATGSRLPLLILGVWMLTLTIVNHQRWAGWYNIRRISGGVILAAVCGISVAIIVSPESFGRLISQTTVESSYLMRGDYTEPGPIRSRIYLIAADELANPWTIILGIGFGNFGQIFSEATDLSFYANPHNVLLKYLLETGIVGFSLMLYVLLIPLQYGYNAITIAKTVAQRSWYIAMTWSYVFLLLFSLFQPLIGHFEFYLVSAILYGAYTGEVHVENRRL